MRALIIENDPAVCTALETALKDFKDREKASDRASVLEQFEGSVVDKDFFDLVVVDIDTPGIQDDSIIVDLRQIEEKHRVAPEKLACLIVISASHSQQLLTDCVFSGCNGIIGKPVDPDQVLEKLSQLNLTGVPQPPDNSLLKRITAKELSNSIIKRIDRGDLELPPAPKIAIRIRQLVDLNADIDEVVKLLKHDLSISTQLIRTSNSVAYGGFEKNLSTGQAVRRLGIDRSVEVVMAICCRGYFVTNHPDYKQLVEDLWWHSLACAHAATRIAGHKKIDVEEDLFALGLLHDIGKLILIQAASNLQMPKKSGMDIEPEALQSMLTDYHGQIGMRILRKWGYSKAFAALIQHHRVKVESSPSPVMQVLHEADLLAVVAGFGYGAIDSNEAAEQLKALGYMPTLQNDLVAQISAHIEQLRYSFG